ncbi:lantibiotic dehydratase [Streptomyces sp. TRM 70351]|uniref:lantibiotic dehydratase n=1 Tax=Streptomyces sp. TRM 70351 TaxID=3116552 RepID=UPI002E7BB1D4|nr:lantibiotic dehydratase [Streptomyces sp. TRM 70351]MEE1926718.1 lantibiotic dehydratase [Streptomyces sp. TRM 70351]
MTLTTSDTPAPAQGEPAPPAATWEPGRRFLLRVAGLPVETVHGLRCPATRRWADRVLAEEERLRADGAVLSELLHGLVQAADATGGDAARRTLLALRRHLFNNRLPADPAAAAALVAGLDGPAGKRVAAWLHDRAALADLRERGAASLAGELRTARGALRRALSEERFRAGLLLASPTLDGRLDAYLRELDAHLGGTGPEPGKRMRKIERSALTYLYRTACKTSPFSSFTAVALGTFAGEGTDGRAALHTGEEWTSHVRLNVVVLRRLAELITADPVRRQDLPVVLSPGWGRDDDRIRYVRHLVTAGDDRAAVTFDAVRDRLFYLRSSGTLERLLDLFGSRSALRHRDLVDWLQHEHGAERAECERYAAALLQLGMVQVPCLHTDVHSPDPLRSFQDALRDLDSPWADHVARSLDGPAACLDRYPAAGIAERRTLLAGLRGQLLEIQRELGAPDPVLPQTLLYEDVSAGDDLECGPGVLTGATGRALRAVEGVLPMFDVTLPQRITLRGFFTARYGRGGRCEDLLGLVHDFHEDFFDQYVSFTAKRSAFDENGAYVPEENWLGQAALGTLDDARRRFVDGMRELWARARETGAEEIELPGGLLAAVGAGLAPITPGFAPLSHHLQLARPAPGGGQPLAVLNRSYGGLAFPFSRFTHVYDGTASDGATHGAAQDAVHGDTAAGGAPASTGQGLSALLREEMRARQPHGAVFAELTGGPVTSNLNQHGRLTDYQIVCPGETSTVPEEDRVHLDDLYVEHDEAADRLVLRSRRLGREVVPVYLGYLVPVALPEIPRTLLLFSPSTMTPTDIWGGVPQGPAADGVTRRPRVRHGDVVISRRSWSADASVLPVRRPGTGEAEWYLEWQRWRRAHGLPDQVFATVSRGGPGAKPVHVDFDSHLSLTAFDALVDREPGSRVTLREALPAEDGLHVTSQRGRHVAELAVETFTSRTRPEEPAACRN